MVRARRDLSNFGVNSFQRTGRSDELPWCVQICCFLFFFHTQSWQFETKISQSHTYHVSIYAHELLFLTGIFKVALSHDKLGISKDVMAAKVLPFIIPVSIDSNLNLAQV